MKKRMVVRLKCIRQALPEEYVIHDYPLEMLLGFRKPIEDDKDGWRALTFDRNRLNYKRLKKRGALDVVFHHRLSGLMFVSPSLTSGLHWRIVYPGDAVLCVHSIFSLNELLATRYELKPPPAEWVQSILEIETPWYVSPDHDPLDLDEDDDSDCCDDEENEMFGL